MYDVMTSFVLTIERDELPENHDDLLESVTLDELADGPMQLNEIEWDNLKVAWFSSTSDNTTVFDAEDESIDYYA